MLGSPAISRALALTGAVGALAAGLVATPAASAGPAAARSVTVLLKAPDPAGLGRLARAHGLTHDQRVARLSRLLPSVASRQEVVTALRARGFTVTHETAWTVDARAAAPTVAAAFGTVSAAAAELPRVPAAMAGATAAVLNHGGPRLFRPHAACAVQCHDGSDFRNAYSAPRHVLHRGKNPNGPLTVATLQFPLNGGWNESDLTKYAESVGLPDPVASGQYTQIPVDSDNVPGATTTEQGADEEVDLDQETLLSTAPFANQRAYFDTSATAAAYTDALSQVLADVTQGPGAVDGGDPKIAVLSTSWGACEQEFTNSFAFPNDTVHAVDKVLQALTAAGVTIFGATGDDGVYDCGDSATSTKIAVDYPASSPQVVAVGGTRLTYHHNSAANDGTNWTDTGWTCASPRACQSANGTGGSGGGESKLFAQPDYQRLGIGRHRFTTATGKKGDLGAQHHRLVPDIAADGDPASGFQVLTTDPTDVKSCALGPDFPTCHPKTLPFGGTSLAAPASAALFADLLAAHGATAGVGDIHDALYSAYAAHRSTYRDVTKGRNGAQADVDRSPHEFPVTALKGYDTVTGLGAPLWPALKPYLFSPAPPTPVVRAHLATPHSRADKPKVTASWDAKLAKHGASLPASASVSIVQHGSTEPVWSRSGAAVAGSHTFDGRPGAAYTVAVTDTDLAGGVSSPVTTTIAVPYDDHKLRYHGKWTRVHGRGDYGGSHMAASHAGAFAKITSAGSIYSLLVRTGPAFGKLVAFHGGTKLATIDLYSRRTHHREVTFFGTPSTPRKSRTFTVYVAGRKARASTSTDADIDGFARA